jgi:hypothetical protein
MSDIAKLGFAVDTQPLKKGEKALDSFAATGKKTEQSIDKSTKKIKDDFDSLEKSIGKTASAQVKAQKKMAGFGRASGQAGIQFQQFIGQVQGGQGVMLALSQQSADLGFVLGAPLLGAIAGITASLVGMFLPSLLSATKGVLELDDSISKLTKNFRDLTESQQAVARSAIVEKIKEQRKEMLGLAKEVNILGTELIAAERNQSGRFFERIFGGDPAKVRAELVKVKASLTAVNLGIAESEKNLAQLSEGGSDFVDNTESITESLEAQIIALRDGADAAFNYSIAQKLGLDNTNEIPSAIQEQIKTIKLLKAEHEDDLELIREITANDKFLADQQKKQDKDRELSLKKRAREFQQLTKDVESFGGAWTKTGSIIVDAFGDMSNALSDYMDRVEEIGRLEKKVAEARIAFGDDNIQVIKLQQQLDEEKVNAELSGIKSISSATGSLFDEKTAASKAFAALNKIITIAEIALSFQKMAASTTETGVHVANETTKQGANALTAITSAFAAPFPIGFVAGAAMVGIMAGLLGSVFGGGGGGGSGNGTGAEGTALGGGVSESLSKANEGVENILIDQLSELRGLRSDLNEVENLSFGLFRQLLSVDSGHSEIKNRTERALEQSFEGLNKGRRSGSFTNELSAIFEGVGNSINEAVGILGISTRKSLSDFVFRIGTISFDKLSSEDAEKRLNEILSAQSDLMVQSVAPFITQYQQLGEGALETLVRVAKEQAFFNDHLERTGVILEGLSSVQLIQVNQNIIDLIGGFDKFTDASNSFFENFFTEVEQFEFLEQSISDVFDSLGLSMVDSREEFRALIDGIDLTTVEGQELLATLLEINPALSDYIDELERIEAERISLLRDSARDQFRILEDSINLEKQRARAILDVAMVAHNAEISRIDDLRISLDDENELRKSKLVDAESLLNDSFNAEMKRIQDSSNIEIALIQETSNARLTALNDERTAINATASSMRSLVNSINSSLGLSGSTNLISALTSARAGDFSKASSLNISALTTLDPSGFSSAEDLAVQQAINQNRLKEIGLLAGDQLTESELMLAAIDMQLEVTKSSSEEQIAAITKLTESQILGLQEQLNSLLGIDSSVLSIDEAITKFGNAQQELDSLNYEQEQAKLDMLVESANSVFALHEQGYQDELERLDAILVDNEELLNAALGIETSVLSVADAIIALNNSISALAAGSGASIPASPFSPVVEGGNVQDAKQEEIANELKNIRQDNKRVQDVMLRNSVTTARAMQEFKLNFMNVKIVQ